MNKMSRRRFVTQGMLGLGFTTLIGWDSILARVATAGKETNPRLEEDSPAGRLLRAVIAGDLAKVTALLASDGGLAGSADSHGRTAFLLACINGHDEVGATLRAHGYQPDLHELAFAKDWDTFVVEALKTPEVLNDFHVAGGTAMYAAARGGAGSDIWRVYRYTGDPNRRPDSATSESPLRIALDYPDLGVAEATAATLLGNGARADAKEPFGRTSLHVAAERGSLAIVEMLLRKGAQADARDRDGFTPRQLAERHGHEEVAAMLAQPDAVPKDCTSSRRVFDRNGDPYTAPSLKDIPPLVIEEFVGASHGKFDEVKRLLGKQPQLVHAVAGTTEGSVEACSHTGQTTIVDFLLDLGAPYSTPTAVVMGDTERVRQLIADDPRRIYERGAHDFPLLWYPVIGGANVEMMTTLIKAGAEVEQQHSLGTTALHYAVLGGQEDMVTLLLEHGANPHRVSRKFGDGTLSAIDLARARDNEDLAKRMEHHVRG